jgi:hypothetical protein
LTLFERNIAIDAEVLLVPNPFNFASFIKKPHLFLVGVAHGCTIKMGEVFTIWIKQGMAIERFTVLPRKLPSFQFEQSIVSCNMSK